MKQNNNKTVKSTKVKVCEVCQQAKYLTEETIKKALADHSNCIEKYAYILHDKDIDENGKAVSPHYHVIIQLNRNDGRELKHIASWFQVDVQYVSKSTSKSKHKFQDMAKYLTHIGQDKYQYDSSEVHANFDYDAFVNQISSSQKKLEIICKLVYNNLHQIELSANLQIH